MAISPNDTSAPAEDTFAKAERAKSFLKEKEGSKAEQLRPERAKNPFAEKQKSEQQPANFRKSESRSQGITNYIKGKFDKQNLFGSVFLLALTLNTLQNVVVGLNQQKVVEKDGVSITQKDVDMTRVLTAVASATATMWTFFSSRRGETPDGNNMAERMWDSLKHPDRSQVQARELVILPITALAVAGNLYYGANLQNRKQYFPNGMSTSPKDLFSNTQKMLQGSGAPTRIYQAGAAIATTVLAYSSLFGKEAERKKAKETKEEASSAASEKDKPEQGDQAQKSEQAGSEKKEASGDEAKFSKSKSKSVGGALTYPLRVFKVTWEENPKLVMSSALSFLSAVAFFVEGTAKRKLKLEKLDKVVDFDSEGGNDIKGSMLQKPKYANLSGDALLEKLSEYKQEQMKESSSLRRMGIIGMTLNLCGQVYRASQLEKEPGMSR